MVSGTPGHVIRSHRRSRNTFFRFQRRTQKTLLFDPISGPQILSKPLRNPFKNTHKNGTHKLPKKQQKMPKMTPKWEPKRVYFTSFFAVFFPYRPEDWKSLENEVAEPQNRPQNVKKCSPACPNHPPKTCETSPLPEPISTSSSTSSACLCPAEQQCAKWGACGVPAEGVFN